jgi:hypothetical protein
VSLSGAASGGILHVLFGAYLRRRHAMLFYSMLVTLSVSPFLAALNLDARLLQPFLVLNLLAAVLGAFGRSRWRPLLLVLAAITVARLVAAWLDSPLLATAVLPLWTMLALAAAASALRFAMRAVTIDAEHIYAALNAYLLGGLFFGVLYWAIERTWTGSLIQAGAVASPGEFPLSSAIYFSFVTLATLGYGDVVPASETTRGLAVVEAVAGQFYIAVLVASLVSLYVRGRVGGKSG